MGEFIIPQSQVDRRFLKKITEASSSRSLLVKEIVKQSRPFVAEINTLHKSELTLHLYDASKNLGVDLSGWVLQINQLLIKPEWGYTLDDPYQSFVGRVEIGELEVNGGKPKLTIKEWLKDGKIEMGEFPLSVSIEPIQVIHYLQLILETGNARLNYSDQRLTE